MSRAPAEADSPLSLLQATADELALPIIAGTGVDLALISRIEALLARHHERFLDRVLCAEERAEVVTRGHVARAVAMCFAAKEAFVKALGTGFVGVGYRDVGVVRNAAGKPQLIFSARLQLRLREAGVCAAHVSLSDDGGWACAYVVLERSC